MKHLLTADIDGANWSRIIADENGVFVKGFDLDFSPYKLIDLGLPSGTLWADRNIGASSPEDAGLYFQWGDTQGYTADQCGTGEGQKAFSWNDCKFGNPTDGFNKYNATDGKLLLDPEDDAATVNMGSKYRMPTKEQMNELFNPDNTTMKWVVQTRATDTDEWGEESELDSTNTDGMNFNKSTYDFIEEGSTKKFLGVRFYGKGEYTNNFIFVPAAGDCGGGFARSRGYLGYLWSSSLDRGGVPYAVSGNFVADGHVGVGNFTRYGGHSVRGVTAAQ